MKFLQFLEGRLPSRQALLGVYAVVVCVMYSWMLVMSFYRLPSWLFFLNPSQIASIYAYAFVFVLGESALVFLLILLFEYTLFLFVKARHEFLTRAVIMVTILLAAAMLRLIWFNDYDEVGAFVSGEPAWWAQAMVISLLSGVLLPRIRLMRTVMEGFADRAIVFLYIYLPLSAIGLVVVIWRNVF